MSRSQEEREFGAMVADVSIRAAAILAASIISAGRAGTHTEGVIDISRRLETYIRSGR